MTKRTDIHSPATFDPAEYHYIGMFYQGGGDTEEVPPTDPEALAALDRSGFDGNFAAKRTCDHCGARFNYGAVFMHTNGDAIAVGHICANEAFGHNSRLEYDRARMAQLVAGMKKRGKIAAQARAFVEAHPGLEAALQCPHHISQDLKAKLLQYGNLSEKQVALAMKLPADYAADADKRAAREAAKAMSQHVGTVGKREAFTVTVQAMPSWETVYGTQYAVIMTDADGNKLVWKTSSPWDVDKGQTYEIKATVKEHGERDGEKQTVVQRVAVARCISCAHCEAVAKLVAIHTNVGTCEARMCEACATATVESRAKTDGRSVADQWKLEALGVEWARVRESGDEEAARQAAQRMNDFETATRNTVKYEDDPTQGGTDESAPSATQCGHTGIGAAMAA